MIIDGHIKQVETIFKLAPAIRAAVVDERAQREAKHHGKDPTGNRAVDKVMPVSCVRVPYGKGTLCIDNPEAWLDVVREIYVAYSNHPIGQMAKLRLEGKRSPAALAELMGVSRERYYGWYREFLRDAVFLASEKGLLKEIQKIKM